MIGLVGDFVEIDLKNIYMYTDGLEMVAVYKDKKTEEIVNSFSCVYLGETEWGDIEVFDLDNMVFKNLEIENGEDTQNVLALYISKTLNLDLKRYFKILQLQLLNSLSGAVVKDHDYNYKIGKLECVAEMVDIVVGEKKR